MGGWWQALMSPWQTALRWQCSSEHSSWNVIHFFSVTLRNGRVLSRSYRLLRRGGRGAQAAAVAPVQVGPHDEAGPRALRHRLVRLRIRVARRDVADALNLDLVLMQVHLRA